MEKEIVFSLTNHFEELMQKTSDGVEYWCARDLQHLLGYSKWSNFQNVLAKAKTACELSKQDINDHFADVGKTIEMPKTATKEIDDIMLTRYACYLVAQNGDSKKQEIAFAQTYFAVQTRKAEVIEQILLQQERLEARNKLVVTEKELSKIIYEQTGGNDNFALIRSKGDYALFNNTTAQMKEKWKINQTKPLADFMPTLLLKAKDFATEITIYNAKNNNMNNEKSISNEHITNNKAIRETLKSRGITPENIPPQEDIKKVERQLNTQTKKALLGNSKLKKNEHE